MVENRESKPKKLKLIVAFVLFAIGLVVPAAADPTAKFKLNSILDSLDRITQPGLVNSSCGCADEGNVGAPATD